MTQVSSNKRIALNTIVLYLRMFITMAISLYISRLVLNELGVVDYGVFNVVGGIVVFVTLISTAFSGSTQRFLSFCLGKKDMNLLKKYFLTILNIHLILAIILLLIAEFISQWILDVYLKIPLSRLDAAHIVYQFSIFTTIFSLISIPYQALLISYEEMTKYAYVSIFEQLLKLSCIIIIGKYCFYDKLIFYSISLFCVGVIVAFSYYRLSSSKHKEIIKYKLYFNKVIFRDIWNFVSWAYLGNLSGILKEQGVNLVIGHWFGVATNAARGVSVQVYNALNSFGLNIASAIRPQITKSFASGDVKRSVQLMAVGTKYSFFMVYLISLPFILKCPYILKLWLGIVPDGTITFTRLMIIMCFMRCTFEPAVTLYLAQGKIKESQIFASISSIVYIFMVSLAFYLGKPAYFSVIIGILFDLLNNIALLYFLNNRIQINILRYMINPLSRIFAVVILSLIILYFLDFSKDYGFLKFISDLLITAFVVFASILVAGLESNEYKLLWGVIIRKLNIQ